MFSKFKIITTSVSHANSTGRNTARVYIALYSKLAFTWPKAGRPHVTSRRLRRLYSRAFGVCLGSVWDGPASKATGHAPRPPRELVRSVQACAQDHCAVQRSWPMRTFSKWGILHCFPNFYTLRVEIFRIFFVHVCLWPLWTMRSFIEIGPHVFEKSGRQTDTHTHPQTDAATLYIEDYSQLKMIANIGRDVITGFTVGLGVRYQEKSVRRLVLVKETACWRAAMYPGRSASATGDAVYQAPLRAGALNDPDAVGVYSSAAYAAVAAAAHGYVPFSIDTVAFCPSLQVVTYDSLISNSLCATVKTGRNDTLRKGSFTPFTRRGTATGHVASFSPQHIPQYMPLDAAKVPSHRMLCVAVPCGASSVNKP